MAEENSSPFFWADLLVCQICAGQGLRHLTRDISFVHRAISQAIWGPPDAAISAPRTSTHSKARGQRQRRPHRVDVIESRRAATPGLRNVSVGSHGVCMQVLTLPVAAPSMMEAIRPARESEDVKRSMEGYVLAGRAVLEDGRGAGKYRLQQRSISTLDEKM